MPPQPPSERRWGMGRRRRGPCRTPPWRTQGRVWKRPAETGVTRGVWAPARPPRPTCVYSRVMAAPAANPRGCECLARPRARSAAGRAAREPSS
eukprot:scaffold31800_cov112-Isochrysis_galbana.AAC.4